MANKRKNLKAAVLSTAALGICISSTAFADAFQSMANQRNNLPGGRAAMMGGAFTAVADDSSASFFNPAGLALIKESRMELSATSFRDASIIYHETVNEKPFLERSNVIYPSFFGGTSRFDWISLGYSFMTLDSRNIYQQDKYENISEVDSVANSYSRTYQESSTYVWAGISAAFKLSENLSFGSSVFYYQRNIEYTASEILSLNGGGFISIHDTLKTLNTGAATVNGFLWRRKSLSLGASVKLAVPYSNSSTLYVDRIEYLGPASGQIPDKTSSVTQYGALNEMNPTTWNVGVAYRPWSWFLISADGHLHEGVKSRFKDQGGHDLHETLDYSLGTSIGGQAFSILGGYFTNNSMFREPNPEYAGQPLWINYRGRSTGMSWTIGGFSGQVGYIEQTGRGKAQIRSGDPDIQEASGTMKTFVISGKVPL